mmetsp:Transcript_74782/g.241808  ORF Transcript_74782/g.241808 Transcript_74782/m.241808 type:complete len:235 (-) Transcript_74782:8-712(-)
MSSKSETHRFGASMVLPGASAWLSVSKQIKTKFRKMTHDTPVSTKLLDRTSRQTLRHREAPWSGSSSSSDSMNEESPCAPAPAVLCRATPAPRTCRFAGATSKMIPEPSVMRTVHGTSLSSLLSSVSLRLSRNTSLPLSSGLPAVPMSTNRERTPGRSVRGRLWFLMMPSPLLKLSGSGMDSPPSSLEALDASLLSGAMLVAMLPTLPLTRLQAKVALEWASEVRGQRAGGVAA